jgi:hypothetical protein
LEVAGWQVIDEGDRVQVLLAGADTVDPSATAEALRTALAGVGAKDIPVAVALVDATPRTTLGKAPPAAH